MIVKKPTQWTYGEGRCPRARKTEAVFGVFRGSRGGMLRKINSPVLEAPCSDAGGVSTGAYKETKSQRAALGVGGVHITD